MSTLVIFDSRFGNTEKIARAIGEALGAADVVRVSDARPEQLTGIELLIVGSPTHGFRATPATTELLKAIPDNALQGVKVAAFDTRLDPDDVKGFGGIILRPLMSIFGYAAKPIANRLTAKGGELAAPPEGFIVLDREGPLRDGELERAGNWARRLRPDQ